MKLRLPAFLAAALLLACSSLHAQTVGKCPAGSPAGATCYFGVDPNGAHYVVAIPAKWNAVLVMHVRGGPYPQHLADKRALADAKRWVVWVREGYALAISEYRRGGYGARMAAEDTDNLRKFFIARFGEPRRTILHGQSWGGLAGAKAIELAEAAAGKKPYDGALLTSGMLAGVTHGYDFRLDLRAVYQYYCQNHPRADEAQYPLWNGLPAGSKMGRDDLRVRVNACTGVDLPEAQRTVWQKRNLANIANVVKIRERSLQGSMNWATFMFADIVHNRLEGRNPFGNAKVRYAGSDNDRALNRGVARYRPDPKAVAALAEDSDLTGRVTIPTLTLHAIEDPVAFVETESAYLAARERAGTQNMLVQSFTYEHEHSYLSSPEYAAQMRALLAWIDTGRKPTPDAIAADCLKHPGPGSESCHFLTSYTPKSYDERVAPRRD